MYSFFNKFFHLYYKNIGRTLLFIIYVFVVVAILPKEKRFNYEYEKGKIWVQPSLVSPIDYPIEKTPEEIEKDKQKIISSILPVYRFDSRVAMLSIEAFNMDFEGKWRTRFPYDKEWVLKVNKNAGVQLLEDFYKRGVISLNNNYQHEGDQDYNLMLVQNNVSRNVNSSSLYTIDRAMKKAESYISKFPLLKKDFILELISNHIQVNAVFDQATTQKIEEESIKNISVYRGMVHKNELIVSEGDIVTNEIFNKLESLRKQYQSMGMTVAGRGIVALGQFILVSIAFVLLIVFLYNFRKKVFYNRRKIYLILIIILGMLLTLSWVLQFVPSGLYYIPYCIVPIIVRLLFDARLALNIYIMVIAISGFFVSNGFEFIFYQMTAGMVAIYSIQNLLRRSQYLFSAILILLTYEISFLAVNFIHEGSFERIDWINMIPFVFSVIMSLLAYPLIYLFEKLFNVTSDITLMELSNTNNLLLRELSIKAPGTFQHSLQVANLAEAAIYKIKGNALLTRAGALYHDIGKMRAPNYFVENQKQTISPHDDINYEESAKIIIRHVSDGVEIAHKNNLPKVIIDFIRTHHGTTRVDYFYNSFVQKFPDRTPDESVFQYPGPIPFSKETGVLMLADSVEAASKSLKEYNAESIGKLVDNIVQYKINNNQLINTPITLKDVETIKVVFKQMLMSIYHVRIDYNISKNSFKRRF